MSPLDSKMAARVLSLLVAAATVIACGQLAGIDDAPVDDDALVAPGGNAPAKPGGTVDERTDESIVITPNELDFGAVPCGAAASAKLITIQNKGSKATTYKVVIPDNPSFTIMGNLEGPLAGAGVVTLQVLAKPIAANDNTTDLVITAGGAVRSLKPKVRGIGATLEIVPALWNFGEVRKQTDSSSVPFDIVNHGNAPAVITSFKALKNVKDFALTGATFPLTVEGNDVKATIQAKMTAGPDSPTAVDDTISLETRSTLCGAPATLTLKGKRVNADVLISGAEWGRTGCAATPGSKDVTITNYSLNGLTYSATLAPTSAFTIVGGATGTVNKGDGGTMASTAKIVVKPKLYTTALNLISETLTVTFTNPSPPPDLTTTVSIDYRGAIVGINPTLLTFMSDGTTRDTKTFTATNTGNEQIYLHWALQRTAGGPAWNAGPPQSLGLGQTKSGSVDFLPSTTGTSTAKLTVDFTVGGTNLCKAIPAIDLQGTKP